ncbi:hypothetical protein MAPG_03525 [Magnaporthiopsis poae ATCC 64411]|uniref:Thioesterase domain-containing protein n=1 Tax=Magnaporthiopsis poae (strain ATCC 64411 / 73-15) TaxID=644358 RepID=A0A0C4DU88_MAGP6|nr:hypothetical protein MAPG_03525 [Magnaporthiopsis poae ATCC 64411]
MTWTIKPSYTNTGLTLDEAIASFISEPWCAKLLTEPSMTVEIPASRYRKPSGEDELFAHTLNNKDNISAYLSIYKTPQPEEAVKEITLLFRLGSGLNGYPATIQGGIVAALFDEATGSILILNMLRRVWPKIPAMTAYLNTTFLKPVPACAVVLCRARVDKIDGRKVFLSAVLEDGNGNALAKAEALFVYRKKPKLKL